MTSSYTNLKRCNTRCRTGMSESADYQNVYTSNKLGLSFQMDTHPKMSYNFFILDSESDEIRNIIPFWLAVHGKPVLFWKGTSVLKFPCFTFMHANGTGPFEFRAVPIL